MKKLFLLVAFTGIVGASSALSVVALNKASVITLGGDEKKSDDKKKDDKKACCKKGESAKACSGDKSEAKGKACCHAKTASAATPATPATK
jgi:hypothetical protein